MLIMSDKSMYLEWLYQEDKLSWQQWEEKEVKRTQRRWTLNGYMISIGYKNENLVYKVMATPSNLVLLSWK